MDRKNVFISYSRQDRKWLDALHVHLNYLERHHQFIIWDDAAIRPGTEWRKSITEAMESAKVAILLVSAHFLASDFINEEELPSLLRAADQEGAVILPIMVSHCMFDAVEAIARFQAVNPVDRPLIDMSEGERDALFVTVTKTVKAALLDPTSPVIKPQAPISIQNDIKDQYRQALARTTVLLLLSPAEAAEGLTISELHERSKLKQRKYIVATLQELEAAGYLEKYKKERKTYWKLSAEGKALVNEFAGSVVFKGGK